MRESRKIKLKSLFNNDIWSQDTSGSSKLWRGIVKTVKIARITVGTFTENRMGFQCVSLSYFVTLAICPFVAMLIAISGGIGLSDRLAQALHLLLPSNPDIVNMVMSKADNIIAQAHSGGAGIISALMFLWAILWMMFQVERIFNNVWGILKIPRKIYKRFGFYFLVILLSPLIIFIFGSGIAFYTNIPRLLGLDLSHVKIIVQILGWVILYFVVVFTLSAMYKFIPSVKVEYRLALKSAFMAGVVFVLFQYVYLETQVFMARLNTVYGVIAAVPLFLIWLNLSWQIIIYGAELTYSFQNLDKYSVPEWNQTEEQ